MTDHATLSPSKRGQWKRCPGSIREQARYPDPGAGPSAIDGTHSHTLLEHCVKAGGADPTGMVGVRMKDHEGEFVIDADRASRVKIAIDYVRQRTQEIVNAGFFNLKVLAESRVEPQWLLGRDDMGGTVDIQIFGGDLIEVIDYKDGIGQVDALNNDQLEQYATGVLAGFKLPINVPYPFTKVRMTIIQPKLAFKGLPVISSHEVTVQEILDKIPTLVTEAAATDAADAPLVPGESQCKFCRAKGSCAALAGNVMKEIGVMFSPVIQSVPILDVAQQSASKDPNTMSDQQIREIMEAAPLVRQLLEAVDTEALRRFNAGVSIPGLKAVYGRGSRAWALPEDQIADKLIKMGVPKSSVYETKLVTPAKAEKLVWEKTKAGEKTKAQLSDRQLKTLESEYVVKMAGKLTIVSESDPRPPVVLNAAPLFSAVESPAEVEQLPSWLV
jgi:hypothetical protein